MIAIQRISSIILGLLLEDGKQGWKGYYTRFAIVQELNAGFLTLYFGD